MIADGIYVGITENVIPAQKKVLSLVDRLTKELVICTELFFFQGILIFLLYTALYTLNAVWIFCFKLRIALKLLQFEERLLIQWGKQML